MYQIFNVYHLMNGQKWSWINESLKGKEHPTKVKREMINLEKTDDFSLWPGDVSGQHFHFYNFLKGTWKHTKVMIPPENILKDHDALLKLCTWILG